MRSPRIDYTPAVTATGWGLFSWALSRYTVYLFAWAVIILFFTFPWLFILPAAYIVWRLPFWVMDVKYRRSANKARDERHRQKYGRDPRPW